MDDLRARKNAAAKPGTSQRRVSKIPSPAQPRTRTRSGADTKRRISVLPKAKNEAAIPKRNAANPVRPSMLINEGLPNSLRKPSQDGAVRRRISVLPSPPPKGKTSVLKPGAADRRKPSTFLDTEPPDSTSKLKQVVSDRSDEPTATDRVRSLMLLEDASDLASVRSQSDASRRRISVSPVPSPRTGLMPDAANHRKSTAFLEGGSFDMTGKHPPPAPRLVSKRPQSPEQKGRISVSPGDRKKTLFPDAASIRKSLMFLEGGSPGLATTRPRPGATAKKQSVAVSPTPLPKTKAKSHFADSPSISKGTSIPKSPVPAIKIPKSPPLLPPPVHMPKRKPPKPPPTNAKQIPEGTDKMTSSSASESSDISDESSKQSWCGASAVSGEIRTELSPLRSRMVDVILPPPVPKPRVLPQVDEANVPKATTLQQMFGQYASNDKSNDAPISIEVAKLISVIRGGDGRLLHPEVVLLLGVAGDHDVSAAMDGVRSVEKKTFSERTKNVYKEKLVEHLRRKLGLSEYELVMLISTVKGSERCKQYIDSMLHTLLPPVVIQPVDMSLGRRLIELKGNLDALFLETSKWPEAMIEGTSYTPDITTATLKIDHITDRGALLTRLIDVGKEDHDPFDYVFRNLLREEAKI